MNNNKQLHDKFTSSSTSSHNNSEYALEVIGNDIALLTAYIMHIHFNCTIIDYYFAENTFKCDFYCQDPISTKDFPKIEDLLMELIKSRVSIEHDNSHYSINGIKFNNNRQHSDSVSHIPEHFTITGISGLSLDRPAQRISGQLFFTKKELDDYKEYEEEAKEFDHRILGAKLGIFRTDSDLMKGMIMWLPDGVKILETLKQYIREVMQSQNYNEVITPPFADLSLWKKSGHWDMYKENMFEIDINRDNEHSRYALKPMNCPLHTEIFKYLKLSYKQLPYKIAEFGFCNRYESSGSLHGLFRARGFTQDDAHVFCMPEQIEGVIVNFCKVLRMIYSRFGFDDITVKLSTRPEKYAGSIDIWDKAEEALAEASHKSELEFTKNEGDGAFYGPKLDFYIKDSRNRVWQCGTVQLDFVLPDRLEATYVDADGEKKTPVMIHHAVLGSLERFIGVLLEHTHGKLPFFLAPNQIVIVPIGQDCNEYANKLSNLLKDKDFRVIVDTNDGTVGYKIRHWWSDMKIPVICLVGKQELSSNTVSLRINGAEILNQINLDEMVRMLEAMGSKS